MKIPVDIWLRGTNTATTKSLDDVRREPAAWTDEDVRQVLAGMLKAMHALKHPSSAPLEEQSIALRGISWIVNPYEDGGVVIALEITMGAAIAGPLAIDKSALETMISRVLVPHSPATSVH